MGLVKRLMMEAEENDWNETGVCFECPSCKAESDGEVELPVLYQGNLSEVHVDIELKCIHCEQVFGASLIGDKFGDLSLELKEYPEVEVDFEPIYVNEKFDDWELEYYLERPDDPHTIFKQALVELKAVMKGLEENSGDHALNRMVFMQCFAIFEAYLCDRYLNLVFAHERFTLQFLQRHDELKKEKIDLATIFSNKEQAGDLVEAAITKTIKDTLFHNLGKAIALFNIFGVPLFASVDHKSLLFDAVPLRHDCVHRNGHNKDGEKHESFTTEYLVGITTAIKETVASLEEASWNVENDHIVDEYLDVQVGEVTEADF